MLAVSVAPLGGRLRDLPAMVLDAGTELPAYGDVLGVPARAGRVELAGAPVAAAPGLGLTAADRVLTRLAPATPDGLAVGLLAPLAAGAALVLAPGDAPLDARAVAAEGVTASAGADVPGARSPRLTGYRSQSAVPGSAVMQVLRARAARVGEVQQQRQRHVRRQQRGSAAGPVDRGRRRWGRGSGRSSVPPGGRTGALPFGPRDRPPAGPYGWRAHGWRAGRAGAAWRACPC